MADRIEGSWSNRYENVEVRVGTIGNGGMTETAHVAWDLAISCGVQSYPSSSTNDNTIFNYICPANTVGQYIFIKKLGTTDAVFHVNLVTVKTNQCL